MCTQNNHVSNSCQENCCSDQLFMTKKKKLEKLNNCLGCMQEKESAIKEAIEELEK